MELFDINEVCRMFGTTSRTLRFYESKGIISSTSVPFKSRRQYNAEQIDLIKKVLVLRSLGLSIAQIQNLQKGDSDLSVSILEHKAKLIASIDSKSKEIRLLDEALLTIEDGGDIFVPRQESNERKDHRIKIADEFANIFISGDYDLCFSYLTQTLQDYMPITVFKRAIKDTLAPIGAIVCKDKIECDKEHCNVIYVYLKYEKLGMRIKLVFYNDMIHGIWLNYYDE